MKQNFIISAFLCCMMFIGCKDDDVASGSFDPSQPVEFKDFSPKEGQVRTRLYIYGKNGSVRKSGCVPSYNPIKIIFLCHETMASVTHRIS